MGDSNRDNIENTHRRSFGIHLTSSEIFLKYIFPEIKEKIWKYKWIDLYAGEGNLILPILDSIPMDSRIDFFKDHINLFDIQPEMVEISIKNAEKYGIPPKIASRNIKLRNNLDSFPRFLINQNLPLFHITNPPYLYLGYIRKHKETQEHLKYFKGKNEGYQDLYQIAMINDLRNDIEDLIYIIPTNFLFGSAVSNKFRLDFLKYFRIDMMFIFETKMFDYTGTNVCIGFFKRKQKPKSENIEFNGVKIKNNERILEKAYILKPQFKYRAGSEFYEFLEEYKVQTPLKVNYYLLKKEVMSCKGEKMISVIDANKYESSQYRRTNLLVNNSLKNSIESNVLYVRTVDTGSFEGRVGLGIISDDFNVAGIYVSGNTYRTHPIQIFFEPEISHDDHGLLKDYFNFMLEAFREKLDSEFLTTYKYSNAKYTRKYLGLTQVRKLIQTFPYKKLNYEYKKMLFNLIEKKDFDKIILFLETCKKEGN